MPAPRIPGNSFRKLGRSGIRSKGVHGLVSARLVMAMYSLMGLAVSSSKVRHHPENRLVAWQFEVVFSLFLLHNVQDAISHLVQKEWVASMARISLRS